MQNLRFKQFWCKATNCLFGVYVIALGEIVTAFGIYEITFGEVVITFGDVVMSFGGAAILNRKAEISIDIIENRLFYSETRLFLLVRGFDDAVDYY